MLELKNVCKSYGKKVALKDFTYIFDKGIYGLLGANGAGKSTLMNLLTDNVSRGSGEILYDGREILDMGKNYRELLGSPKILILDEPTAGLDPKERVNFRKYIHRLSEDKIILVATHVVSDVETIADRILVMKDGELVADDSPEVLVKSVGGRNLEDVYMHYFGENEESI